MPLSVFSSRSSIISYGFHCLSDVNLVTEMSRRGQTTGSFASLFSSILFIHHILVDVFFVLLVRPFPGYPAGLAGTIPSSFGYLGGGALPLWRWRGCKAPKTHYFQRCCHPITTYFCWLSLLSPKDPTFFGEMHLHLLFLHTPVTGSYFLFQFHRQIDRFCHFQRFFLQIPAFKALTERSKVTFSPNAP